MDIDCSNDLNPRLFQALVTWIIKLKYYKDTEISIQELQEELFSDSKLNKDDQERLIINLEILIADILKNYENDKQIKQLIYQKYIIENDQVENLLKVFNRERAKIIDQQISQLSQDKKAIPADFFTWKLELRSGGNNIEEPLATAQFTIENNENITFQMDANQVREVFTMLQQVNDRLFTVNDQV